MDLDPGSALGGSERMDVASDISTKYSQPLTYSLERSVEPSPPTWQDLLDDISLCGTQEVLFKSTSHRTSASLPFMSQEVDPVNLAQITLEVEIAARNLTLQQEAAKIRQKALKTSVQALKEDLDDLR